MAIYCDACEQIIPDSGGDVSNCCQADVWLEARMDDSRYICQGCNSDCKVIKLEEVKK